MFLVLKIFSFTSIIFISHLLFKNFQYPQQDFIFYYWIYPDTVKNEVKFLPVVLDGDSQMHIFISGVKF